MNENCRRDDGQTIAVKEKIFTSRLRKYTVRRCVNNFGVEIREKTMKKKGITMKILFVSSNFIDFGHALCSRSDNRGGREALA